MSGIDKNGRAGNSSETSKRQTNKTKTKHKPKQNQNKPCKNCQKQLSQNSE